ncbi:hypothetical protein M654_020130 [Bacillus sp. NSP9.1]|nr:hypothetical protein [Bacillus sp. HSf4]QHZ48416.1 hypothetical protein M654_020130 [Bacillus sp. NSP9.1]WFA05937.1 hypothetical protein P3X63_03720 [Bacillus sp. HSf4]
MAKKTRLTQNGVTVNLVFRPQKRLCLILYGGARARRCLYTDQDNPTSNNIYQEIGYRPVLLTTNSPIKHDEAVF